MALAVCYTLPARAANVTFTILDTSSDTITVSDDNQTGRLSFPGFHLPVPELRGRRPGAFSPYFSRPAQLGLRSVWAGPQQVAVNLLESASPFIVSDTLQQQDQTATSTL